MEPYHYCSFLTVVDHWCPYIKALAMLVAVAPVVVKRKLNLIIYRGGRIGRTNGSVCKCSTNISPWLRLRWWHKAFCLCIRNAFVGINAFVNIPPQLAAFGGYDSNVFAGNNSI